MKAKMPAHRRVNFIPPESRPSLFGPGVLVAFALVCAVGVPVAGGGAKIARWGAERRLASLASERDALAAQVALGVQTRDSSADQRAVAAVKKALSEKVFWAEVFKELTNVAPKGVWLTTFDTSVKDGAKHVVIAGQGPSQAEVTEFFARLERSYYFREVQLKFTEMAGDKAASLYRFQFEGKVFEEPKGGKDGPG